jgi:pyruvate-formate lyase-activating enzyme
VILNDVTADPTLPRTKGVKCGKCGHGEAVFFQSTSRQDTEGMTLFFVCCNSECQVCHLSSASSSRVAFDRAFAPPPRLHSLPARQAAIRDVLVRTRLLRGVNGRTLCSTGGESEQPPIYF